MSVYMSEFALPRVAAYVSAQVEKRPDRGLFIAFDGIDGTGKGTLIEMLKVRWAKVFGGIPVCFTKQPGGSPLGDKIRETLFVEPGTKNIHPDSLELLFLANHIHNTNCVVEPALRNGVSVVTDRHWPSAIAYMKQRGAKDEFRELYLRHRGAAHDVLFLLVGSPMAMLERAQRRTTESHQSAKKWNNVEALTQVQREFVKNFGSDERTCIVDAHLAPVDIIDHIVIPRIRRVLDEVCG